MPLWTEYELCRSVQDESRLENPLDMLARRECGVPLLYVWLLEYLGIRLW